MYAKEKKSCRVSGDVLEVAEKLAASGQNVLIITPLLEDRNRLSKEIKSIQIEVMRVLEAQKSLEAKESTPDVLVVHNYVMVRDMDLFETVRKFSHLQTVLMVDTDDLEDKAVQEYPMVYEEKPSAFFEVCVPDMLHKLIMVFALTKLKPIRKACVVTSTEKEAKRVHFFLDGFGVPNEIHPKMPKDTVVGIFTDSFLIHDYSLIIDLTGEVPQSKTVLLRLGAKTSKGAEKFAKLLDRAREYKYRIESVLKLIDSQVLSGKKIMDFSSIKHLKGPLKMMRY
ncbi:hypothetical protein NECID01_1343 [Nematocida sp. AWRm77]|nr:hypothetical protein NECID01_1343 [Nematocida sp. AWRm77]